MKIGLISINAHTKVLNFASPLHTYAFQQFLFENGIDNVIIDYKPCYSGKFDVRHPYDYYLAHPSKDEKTQQYNEEIWKRLYADREERFDKFEKFINENYIKTDKCYTQNSLDVEDIGCDIYICVTDIIWKYNPKTGFDRGFFLACESMDGKGKIAYAASRGAKGYTAEQTQLAASYLSSFHYIACREKSLADFVNRKTSSKASLVLDPVFLQPASFYEKLCVEPKERGYILIYAVMQKANSLVESALKLAQKKNLLVIDISDDKTIVYHSPNGERITKYNLGVEEWLGYMKHASYIFTNSFHCCCFSIIFQKEFFVGKRDGDKVSFLLKLFGLSNRLISEKTDYNKTIDYTEVDKLRERYTERSKNFILKAIEKTAKQTGIKPKTVWDKLFLHKKKIPGIEQK